MQDETICKQCPVLYKLTALDEKVSLISRVQEAKHNHTHDRLSNMQIASDAVATELKLFRIAVSEATHTFSEATHSFAISMTQGYVPVKAVIWLSAIFLTMVLLALGVSNLREIKSFAKVLITSNNNVQYDDKKIASRIQNSSAEDSKTAGS